MVRGVALSMAEKREIKKLKEENHLSPAEIALAVHRPYETVRKLCLREDMLTEPKKRGRKAKLNLRDRRRIKYQVRKTRKISVRNLTTVTSLDCSPSTTLRTMKAMNMRKKRINYAEEYLTKEPEDLQPIIFSDEKKFRFNGPDGWAYYWIQLGDEKDEVIYSKDYGKFKGVMVHATISKEGLLTVLLYNGVFPEPQLFHDDLRSILHDSSQNGHSGQITPNINDSSTFLSQFIQFN
ncbi:MAG: hypothetical protein EZS28_017985 [Streblomastix strix]|uniref:Transposable element Tc3 transposase n=1 Tax=Streblomastix strix TaxID=222440 RepID=A0A5J4VW32_9EUKA|nr:MAG: hypothetical protein EZS28_017985 [Streblomastix strix]